MAARPLGLHPALRPWYAAGLHYVYLDDEALARLAGEQEARKEAAAPKHMQRAPERIAPERAQARQIPSRPQQNQEAKPSPSAPQASTVSQTRRTNQGPQASTLPPDQWPQAWQDRLHSTLATSKGAPVLWTYWALGEDLSGAPNAPRRDILRRILGELNLPRGTHCFWPVAMPSDGTTIPDSAQAEDIQLEANAPLFLAGLHILAPRVCVVMGSKALHTILPHSTIGPFQQIQHGRTLFLVLPDMDMLLAESERIPRIIAYLRSALQPFTYR